MSEVSRFGEYAAVQVLTPDQTFLAISPGGRRVVLKILDGDVLQRGQLHPNIHSRLARVRELAHRGVANLIGVERAEAGVFAVWEYAPGETLDRYAASLASPVEFTQLAREIMLAVQSLHALGIVHGRIHAGNVIIDELKQVKLTHISPLLYDDPVTDVHDLITMLRNIAGQRDWGNCESIKSLDPAGSLTQLRMRMSAAPSGETITAGQTDNSDKGLRRKAILAAAMVAIIGLAIAAGVMRWGGGSPREKPVPPEAPPRAMQR